MTEEKIFNELISKGVISVKDNRLVIMDSINMSTYGARAWAYTLQEIGKIKNKGYMYKLGYLMGEDSAKEFLEHIGKIRNFITTQISDVSSVIELTGFGVVNIIREDTKIKVIVKKNNIISYGKELYDEKSMIPEFYRGAYCAFINIFDKKDYKLKQMKNDKKDNAICIFESR